MALATLMNKMMLCVWCDVCCRSSGSVFIVSVLSPVSCGISFVVPPALVYFSRCGVVSC